MPPRKRFLWPRTALWENETQRAVAFLEEIGLQRLASAGPANGPCFSRRETADRCKDTLRPIRVPRVTFDRIRKGGDETPDAGKGGPR